MATLSSAILDFLSRVGQNSTEEATPAPSRTLASLQSLIGLSLSAPEVSIAIQRWQPAGPRNISPELKAFSDCVYLKYYEAGASLCFVSASGGKLSKTSTPADLVLDGIDLYNAEGSVASPPASSSAAEKKTFSTFTFLPLQISKDAYLHQSETTGRSLVTALGEPSKKGGGEGKWLDVYLEWEKFGLSVDLREPVTLEKEQKLMSKEELAKGMGGVWDRAGRWGWKCAKVFKPVEVDTIPDLGYPSIASVEGSATRNLPHLLEAVGHLINYIACTAENPEITILEVASGDAEHVIGFAKEWPRTSFQPTERDEKHVKILEDRISQRPHENILKPLKLDLLSPGISWLRPDGVESKFDGVLAFNVLHCSPVKVIANLFELAARNLSKIGWIAIYGAFLQVDNSYASEGDRKFDERFKGLHSTFGLRRVPDVQAAARQHGFELALRQGMPSGNWFLVFERVYTRASIKDHTA